jgi:hypothetical protein
MNIGTLELGVELSGSDGLSEGFDDMGESFNETSGEAEEAGGMIEGLAAGTEFLEGASDLASAGLRRLSNWMGIASISTAQFGTVLTTVTGALTTLGGLLSTAATALAGVVSGISATTVAIGALIAIVAGLILELTGITDVTRVNIEWLKKWLGVAYDVAASLVNDAIQFIIDGFWHIVDVIKNALVDAMVAYKDFVFSIFGAIKDKVVSVFDAIVNTTKSSINDLISGINDIIDKIPKVDAKLGKLEVNDGTTSDIASEEAKSTTKSENVKNENKVEKLEVNFNERADFSNMNAREKRELAKIIGDEAGKGFNRKTN